ncbi:META domain-containing protein [Knoellia flava]|uniref:META domain-containing protein n=1 Tax=Knoellia flava TaxID=913969 RepID=UPI000A017547|nr:META domain-containing protein [Knoellia flava]
MRSRVVLLVVATVVALVGLGSAYAVSRALDRAPTEDAGWVDSLDEVQGEWVSSTGFARDGSTPWALPIRLSIVGERVSLNAGCNTMAVHASVDDHRLRPSGQHSMTAMDCAPAAEARDRWVAGLVFGGPQVSLKGSTEGRMLALDSDEGWIGFVPR